jgi:hypothetical protein
MILSMMPDNCPKCGTIPPLYIEKYHLKFTTKVNCCKKKFRGRLYFNIVFINFIEKGRLGYAEVRSRFAHIAA